MKFSLLNLLTLPMSISNMALYGLPGLVLVSNGVSAEVLTDGTTIPQTEEEESVDTKNIGGEFDMASLLANMDQMTKACPYLKEMFKNLQSIPQGLGRDGNASQATTRQLLEGMKNMLGGMNSTGKNNLDTEKLMSMVSNMLSTLGDEKAMEEYLKVLTSQMFRGEL